MPVLQFKGKTAVENYRYAVPHHYILCFAKSKLRLLDEGEYQHQDWREELKRLLEEPIALQ